MNFLDLDFTGGLRKWAALLILAPRPLGCGRGRAARGLPAFFGKSRAARVRVLREPLRPNAFGTLTRASRLLRKRARAVTPALSHRRMGEGKKECTSVVSH